MSMAAAVHETDDSDLVLTGADYESRYIRHIDVGAAALLLNSALQSLMPHVVLEGAPGQGKSTIAQYVCQVHRMKLLNDEDALSNLRREHLPHAIRLPIKIDLRDLATWLDKKDPFGGEETNELPSGWRGTLESFLAALISAQSGGTNFTVDDLLALLRVSSILIVFDGLDEVADITRRQEVVDEIVKGVQRLEANAASLQTVVTSRPAAFANSPGMPPDSYPYLQLLSLTRAGIDEYADRWLRARRVDSKEAADFKKILRDRLGQPHLRDLARNPMQLAILLSLISTRGTSLPDKRTALYDNYIDLFFNRESEKSAVVREHRDLLIDIHQYLAWVLHSGAERGHSLGSISQDRLHSVLATYLSSAGYDPQLARELFTGVVERVVALVSRVEGTFEFEVQPLREYFAARFLFDTAPYSPTGGERRGTKPDRFDALARNFYWTNVTRFYAGCFSKGELPGLVDRLQELLAEDGYRFTTHPRMLAATLLADWVFTQNPRCVQSVIGLILDGIGLRYLISSGSAGRRRHGLWNPLVLPPKCGRDQLIDACFAVLKSCPAPDYARDVIELLRANASNDELIELWAWEFDRSHSLAWLTYGVQLGALSRIDNKKLDTLIDAEVPLGLLYRARRLDILERSEDAFNRAVEGVLNRELTAQPQRRIESALDSISHAVEPLRYALAFAERAPISLSKLFAQQNRPTSLTWAADLVTNTETYVNHRNCIEFAKVAESESNKTAAEWATELGPWSTVVEVGRQIWGERWAFYCLANFAAGIRSHTERSREASALLDDSLPLCSRARHARLRSANKGWWQSQFDSVRSEQDVMFVALVALTWARPETLVAIHGVLDEALARLKREAWLRLMSEVQRALSRTRTRSDQKVSAFDVGLLAASLSARTVAALGMRASSPTAHDLYTRFLKKPRLSDPVVLQFVQQEAFDVDRLGTKEWSPDLDRIEACYVSGVLEVHLPVHRYHGGEFVMPIPMAEKIASTPDRYPTSLLALAEEACRREVGRKSKAVADVADREGWFDTATTPRLSYE
jgi:hypothetical protein